MPRYRIVARQQFDRAHQNLSEYSSPILSRLLCRNPHSGPTCTLGDALYIRDLLTTLGFNWGIDFYLVKVAPNDNIAGTETAS